MVSALFLPVVVVCNCDTSCFSPIILRVCIWMCSYIFLCIFLCFCVNVSRFCVYVCKWAASTGGQEGPAVFGSLLEADGQRKWGGRDGWREKNKVFSVNIICKGQPAVLILYLFAWGMQALLTKVTEGQMCICFSPKFP